MTTKGMDEIAKTCIRILISEPFYGHYMLGVPKAMTQDVGTAAVMLMNRQMVKLVVNPDFWSGLNEQTKYGLIKHEVLHIVLRHLLVYDKFTNKRLFNLAADIVVNQYILKKQLPEGGITLERFAHWEQMYGIRMERNKDVGYYYDLLKSALDKTPAMTWGEFIAQQQKQGKSTNDPNGPINLSKIMQEGHSELDRHQYWKELQKLEPSERKIMEQQFNDMLKTTVKRLQQRKQSYGNLPGGLVSFLDEMLKDMEPKFDWRRILRLFAASSSSTYLKNTIRRPSKRYGTTPGIKLRRRHRLLLAIDTSGSVPDADFAHFFAEIHSIWRQGAEMTIVECDTRIQATYPYRGILPKKIHGRGGTAFTPPVEYANQEHHPDAIIYFTDGYAPPPSVPSRSPILWVVTSNGIAEDGEDWKKLPGRKVKIN